jgi:hypothetical protein
LEARARVAISSVEALAKPRSMKAENAASRMRARSGVSPVEAATGVDDFFVTLAFMTIVVP